MHAAKVLSSPSPVLLLHYAMENWSEGPSARSCRAPRTPTTGSAPTSCICRRPSSCTMSSSGSGMPNRKCIPHCPGRIWPLVRSCIYTHWQISVCNIAEDWKYRSRLVPWNFSDDIWGTWWYYRLGSVELWPGGQSVLLPYVSRMASRRYTDVTQRARIRSCSWRICDIESR